MKIPILKDFKEWKDLNKGEHFSLYDYMFHVTKLSKINTDVYFAFLELCWPSFVVYENYIILKENFSEEKIEDLIKRKEAIEYWMNFFLTDSYFENEEEQENKAEALGMTLAEIWKVKLKKDFPDRTFTVKYLCDKDSGDYGLTFYQTEKKPSIQ